MSIEAGAPPQYFFIIGAMKAGTTSLYKYLSGHPDLYASPRKEPRVFRDPGEADAQRTALRALFEGRQGQRWCFEASTAYTKHPLFPGVARRIHAAVPDARFVYLVRNPLERVWSQYSHNVAQGRETLAFGDALDARPEYLDISRYHMQLHEYFSAFPRDRVLVQVFEEMVTQPEAAVRQVCDFLCVDPTYVPPSSDVVYNASSDKRTAPSTLRAARSLGVEAVIPWRARRWMEQRSAPLPVKKDVFTPALRARVIATLKPDTEALFGLLGRRVPSWNDFA